MTTAKKKPLKKAPARGQKQPQAARKVAPARPRYSEQYVRALKEYERGITLLQKKNFAEAIGVFQDLAEKFPEEAEICDRARQYIGICQERLPAKGNRSAAEIGDHFHVGVFHLNRGETEAAVTEFQKALEKDAARDMVHYAIASAHAQTGDKAHAVAALSEAIRLNAKNRIYAQNDADFDRIRDDHDFIQLVEPEEARAH